MSVSEGLWIEMGERVSDVVSRGVCEGGMDAGWFVSQL